MTTPNKIEKLNSNQIFVFGSNMNGNHNAGAAKFAVDRFGAIEGQGEGLQGQSYAFPTLNKSMKKVPKKDLIEAKNRLYKTASENPDKEFLVTKVGCGIAGFKEKDLIAVFKGEKPNNIVLPKGWGKVKGYKAFEKGLICKGFQYELGKDFFHNGEIKLCESGFHFCKSLGDVYNYYQFGIDGIIVAEVESEGDVIDEEDKKKSVTNHIRIIRILNPIEASNNSGMSNTGHSNTGDWNTGHWNTGYRNTGHSNTGYRNTGDRNTGHWNTGYRNTGDWNTGHSNTGDWNTGYWNTGHRNTGDWNTGHRNTGDWNTGHSNTGYRNTGYRNTGDWNTGHWNTGDFNTVTPKEILVFNKKCDLEKWEKTNKPDCLFFDIVKWVDFIDMTDEEKTNYPKAKTIGGYLKVYTYEEAFKKSLEKATKDEIEQIKNLPNFDAKIFEEISGFRIS